MTAKVIYTPGTAFGGYEYEARRQGKSVRVYERAPGAARFKLATTLTDQQWQDWFDSIAHDASNPAHISRLATHRA